MIDTAGNPVYNKPLQWIVSSIGQLQLDQDVNNYAPGQYVISDNLAILKPGGEMVTLSTVWLYLYRLAQYMVLYSIVGTVLAAVRGSRPERWPVPAASVDETLTPDMEQRVAAELKRREAASTTLRVVPEEVQEHVRQLKRTASLFLPSSWFVSIRICPLAKPSGMWKKCRGYLSARSVQLTERAFLRVW